MRRGRLVLGVSSACAYGELAWAEEGCGAFLDGKPIHVSKTAELRDAILSTGNLKTLAGKPEWANFGRLVTGVNRLRGPDTGFLVITHYQRLLEYIVPDRVHIMWDGRIVHSGGKELALELEAKGYDWVKQELAHA